MIEKCGDFPKYCYTTHIIYAFDDKFRLVCQLKLMHAMVDKWNLLNDILHLIQVL